MAQNGAPKLSTLTLISTCVPPATSRAWSSAPHPHQPFIATACADKTVRIYSLTSFTLLSTITGGHKRSVRCCAWKPSLPTSKNDHNAGESVLATGSFDASAAIWIGRPSGGEEGIQEGLNRTVDDYDMENDQDEGDFRYAVVLEGHDSEIKSIAWSAHGTFLATCSRDKSVWIWEALDPGMGEGGFGVSVVDDEDNYETVAVMQEHDGDVKCVAWHPTEEQCLISSSYDDDVRVWREDIDGEWGCVAVCSGHEGTVWCVDWEPWGDGDDETNGQIKGDDSDEEPSSGPRIISCSDDLSIRLWRRHPKPKRHIPDGPRIPSTIRSTSDEEVWFEDGRLPQRHERAIYAVCWSKMSKRVVSCGSDGKIIVYEEQARPKADGDVVMSNGDAEHRPSSRTEWKAVAEIESAHGVFEVNHVCWARRADRGKRSNTEEVIISTGDDGEVKIWSLD